MTDASKNILAGRRRFQFSIRRLLIFTAIVAVLTAVGVRVYRAEVVDRRWMNFRLAVGRGDFAEVDRLLRIDPRLAHGRRQGNGHSSHTALQQAILFANDPRVVDRILQERPDVDETSENGRTALHLAVERRKLFEVERLIRLGADVNIADEEGVTPLHLAVRDTGSFQIAKLLLESGADPNMIDELGVRPLQSAARRDGSGQLTKLLLDGGADPNGVEASRFRDAQSNQPRLYEKAVLHIAAGRGSAAAVKHLLDAGANVSSRDADGQTALHLAVSQDHLEVAKLLVEHGADLAAKDHAGLIPGERSDGSNSEVAAVLWWDRIEQLHDQQKTEQLEQILEAAPQALAFRTGYSPETMLHRAVSKKRLDVLDYLLARGMDVELCGDDGGTPLHEACWSNIPPEFAAHLLDAGADIQAEDRNGRTPLHRAAMAHHHEVLQLLAAEGADAGAVDNTGTTVLDAAFESDFHPSEGQRTLELLRQAGHEPTVLFAAATGDVDRLQELTREDSELLDRGFTRNGVRPLHAAVLGEQPGVVRWLIDQGVERNPSTRAYAGHSPPVDTPLMVALSYNKADMAILLIDLGADVDARSAGSGYYPAHAVIAWDRDPKILEVLLARGADTTLQYENKTAVELAIESKSKHRDRYLEVLRAFDQQGRR